MFGREAGKKISNIVLLQQLPVGSNMRDIHCVESADSSDNPLRSVIEGSTNSIRASGVFAPKDNLAESF